MGEGEGRRGERQVLRQSTLEALSPFGVRVVRWLTRSCTCLNAWRHASYPPESRGI